MLIVIVLTVLIVFFSGLYVRWIKLRQYWAKRGVPHIPPNPLFGSLTFLQNENPAIWFQRMYNFGKKPYMGIWIFWRPGIIVNSPDIARNILIKDCANFRNRFMTSGNTDPTGSLNLVTLNDPLSSIIRKRLSVLFTSSKLRLMQKLVTDKSKELVERINKERHKLYPIDLRKVITDFTTDLIGTASLGIASNATLTGTSPVRVITEQFMKFSFIRGWSWRFIFFIPELVDIFRFKLFPTESIENMRKILQKMIAQRGGLEKKVMKPRDLLDVLIKIKQEDGKEINMTEDMMLGQIAVFFQGGFDSTGTTLAFAIYELAFCPGAQEKIIKELEQAKEKYGENVLNAKVLFQMTYLNCVINETLRKYPITGWIDRVALSDYKVDDHLIIKAGTPVYVNAVGMQYDPDYYPEPRRFNPDRFLPDNAYNIKPFTYLPFGEGLRKCIGQRLALSNMRHGLAAVILNYEVRPLPDTPQPSDVELDTKGLFMAPKHLLSVEFIPRKQTF